MKGFCVDCRFMCQEWMIEGTEQMGLVLDTYCFLCDIFKSPSGYCDCFEPSH